MSKFNKPKLVRTNMYFTTEQDAFLSELSEQTGVSKAQFVRIAINEYMKDFKPNPPKYPNKDLDFKFDNKGDLL